jgi:hypothetical protein
MKSPRVEIVGWLKRPVGPCLGELWVQLPSGLIIRHIPFFKVNGQRWLGPASRPVLDHTGNNLVRKPNGKVLWEPVISFDAAATRDRFNNNVMAAARRSHPELFEPEA